MPDLCYLCGKPATLPLQLKDSFTAHSACKVPTSDKMCDRCNAAINGEEKLLWYWNEGKGKWSRLWGRSLSRLYLGDVLAVPTIEGQHTEGKLTAPIVTALATREQMRGWLTNPPKPPFTIAIAESGQKHILPWAQTGHSRDYFPVQFELDSLWIDRAQFAAILAAYEALMGLGFSKTEITSGQYHSDRLMKAWGQYEPFDDVLTSWRGSRLLELVAHVAQKPEEAPPPTPEVAPPPPVIQEGQLALW
jgi:hypothetical protein